MIYQEGMLHMYRIDKKIYKNLKNQQFVVVDGYCFTLDNKNITYEVLLMVNQHPSIMSL